MIDLHCHILPGIDDGAADLEDALEMARQGERDGIEVVCATPHIRHDHDVQIAELGERVADLNRALEGHGIGVRIAQGGELAETAAGDLDVAELREISLGRGGRWVLLEPAPGPIGDSLGTAVRLLRERGYRSLIAHPERHLGPGFRERLAALVRDGALIQVTAAHLQDAAGPALLELAQAGLVHLVGSDAHSARAGRPVSLAGALAALAKVPVLDGHLDWITEEAPAAILRGEDVEPPFPVVA